MAKTDWTGTDTVKPADMNEIGQEINQLREDVDNIHIPPATLTEAGIAQLSSATDSTSEAMAATPKAVKAAMDEALASKQLGVEQKANVVAALNSIGVAASTSETWEQIIPKISAIILASGNAQPSDVLAGKTFTNDKGKQVGALVPGIKMVNGQFPSDDATSGTIANLPFKPLILIARASVYSKRGPSGITVYGGGYMVASMLSGSTPVYYDPLVTNAWDNLYYDGSLKLANCVFGANNVSYNIVKSGFDLSLVSYRLKDYFVFGV